MTREEQIATVHFLALAIAKRATLRTQAALAREITALAIATADDAATYRGLTSRQYVEYIGDKASKP